MADLVERLRANLEPHGLAHRAELLLSLARPTVRLLPASEEAVARVLSGGQLHHTPASVDGVAGATAISAGAFHCLALLQGGAVVGWGVNEHGQLGDGTRIDRGSVVPVHGLDAGVRAVSAGDAHSLALLDDHSVVAWGDNRHGRLVGGSTARRHLTPVPVGPIPGGVVAVAAGGMQNLVLTEDGSIFSWGWIHGPADESSDDTFSRRGLAWAPLPTRLAGFPAGVRSIAAGRSHSLAATVDGEVFEWTNNNNLLMRIPGLENIVAVAADEYRLALDADGSVWAWGWGWGPNARAQLSDGTLVRDQPVRLSGLHDVVGIATASAMSLALRSDGSVWTSGDPHLAPEPVSELASGVRAISAGRSNLALLDDGRVSWWGRPSPPVWDDRPFPPDDLPLAATKLGGRPDLPPEVGWPGVDDVSHAFVAQLNLAEVGPTAGPQVLPVDGLLSFFYDGDQEIDGSQPSDREGWAVLYTPADAPLVRLDFPDDLPTMSRFRPIALNPRQEIIIPSVSSFALHGADLSDDDRDRLWEMEQEGPPYDPIHRLLGHEQPVQPGHMQAMQCQRAAHGLEARGGDPDGDMEKDSDQWRLLLQIDSDEAAGIGWGDAGRIYYWIRAEDLAARRFEKTWLISQQG